MLLLWILGILAALFLLLCLTPVRIRAGLRNEQLTLTLWVGAVRLRLYPRRKPKERTRKDKKPKKKKKPKKPKPEGERRPPVPTLEDVRDALRSLPSPVLRALRRIGRGLRICPLTVSVVFGGWEDPPAAAEAYGTANALLWAGMPVLESWFRIPDPDIRLDVDFTAPRTAVEGEIGVSARIGTFLLAGAGVGIPAVLWLLRAARRRRRSGNDDTPQARAKAESGTTDRAKAESGTTDRTKAESGTTDRAKAENGTTNQAKAGKQEKAS